MDSSRIIYLVQHYESLSDEALGDAYENLDGLADEAKHAVQLAVQARGLNPVESRAMTPKESPEAREERSQNSDNRTAGVLILGLFAIGLLGSPERSFANALGALLGALVGGALYLMGRAALRWLARRK
jgi:hypothetical protein